MGDRWLKGHRRGTLNVSHHVSHQNSNAVEKNGAITYKSDSTYKSDWPIVRATWSASEAPSDTLNLLSSSPARTLWKQM